MREPFFESKECGGVVSSGEERSDTERPSDGLCSRSPSAFRREPLKVRRRLESLTPYTKQPSSHSSSRRSAEESLSRLLRSASLADAKFLRRLQSCKKRPLRSLGLSSSGEATDACFKQKGLRSETSVSHSTRDVGVEKALLRGSSPDALAWLWFHSSVKQWAFAADRKASWLRRLSSQRPTSFDLLPTQRRELLHVFIFQASSVPVCPSLANASSPEGQDFSPRALREGKAAALLRQFSAVYGLPAFLRVGSSSCSFLPRRCFLSQRK